MKGEERVPEVEVAISNMGKAVKGMLEEALNAYINSDDATARQVAAKDEEIDEYFRTIQQQAVDSIRQNPEAAFAGKEYFQVLMYLERIGDYARNICEWVVYLKTGKIVEL